MIGVLVPIHHTGNLMVKMLVWAVEYIFFFQKKALYYLVGTKVGQQHLKPCHYSRFASCYLTGTIAAACSDRHAPFGGQCGMMCINQICLMCA